MKEENTNHVSVLLHSYQNYQAQARNVMLGMVDLSVNNSKITGSITSEQKRALQDIALLYFTRQMMKIRADLASFKIGFEDGCENGEELATKLWEDHGQAMADAAEAAKKGG